jgi:hypothetical protein
LDAAGTDEDWQEAWVADFARWCLEGADNDINALLREAEDDDQE